VSARLSPLAEFSAATDLKRFFSEEFVGGIRRRFEVREQPVGVPRRSCETNLFFGFFFDGTKNNYIQADAVNNHSNVARLYDCYPSLSVLVYFRNRLTGSTSLKKSLEAGPAFTMVE
jgi:hypothetical protein